MSTFRSATLSLLKTFLFSFFCLYLLPTTILADAWYDNDWGYRHLFTVNNAEVVGSHTDFTAYVDLSELPSDFFNNVASDGSDIIVTNYDGTLEYNFELVSIDTTNDIGELHVKIPTVTDSTTDRFFIYYGNSSATDSSNPNQLWQDYVGVWHLDEQINASSATTYESGLTSQTAMDGTDGSWGVFYGANPLDGDVNVAADEDTFSDTERAHTTEEFMYIVYDSDTTNLLRDGSNTVIGEFGSVTLANDTPQVIPFTGNYVDPIVITTYELPSASDEPTVVRVSSVLSDRATLQLQSASASGTPSSSNVYYTVIENGTHTLADGSRIVAGKFPISSVNTTSNWNSSEMQDVTVSPNFTTPLVFSQIQTMNDGKWQATWNSSGGSHQNRPTSTSIFVGRHVGADSDQIRATEDLGYFIIEAGTWDTGEVVISAALTSDTVEGVDDSAPYTFDPGGTTLSTADSRHFKDATINTYDAGYNGTILNLNDTVVGRGINLDGSAGTNLPIEDLAYSTSNGISELTAGFWIRTTQSTRSGIFDYDRSEHWSVGLNFHNASGQNGQISFDTAASTGSIGDLNSGVAVNDGDWHYVTVVYDHNATNDKKIYIDGQLTAQADQHTTPLGKTTQRFGFLGDGSEAGSFNSSTNGLPQGGDFDELFLTHEAWSADLIETHYNNQLSPSTFFTVSATETRNVAPEAPTNLYVNHTDAQSGLTNPSELPLYTQPIFTAIHNDPDTGDTASTVEIQVSTDATFSSVTHWDSGTSSIAQVTEGARSADILYGSVGNSPISSISMDDGNVNYYWRLRFIDAAGETGEWSSVNTFSVLDIPTEPNGVSVAYTAPATLSINWADQSVNEDGFIIERQEDSGGGFGAWTSVTTVGQNVTNHVDTTPVANSSYRYRVIAYNYAGQSLAIEDPTVHYTDPEAPTNVHGLYINDTSFNLNWTDNAPVVLQDLVAQCVGDTDCDAGTYTTITGSLVDSTDSPLLTDSGIIADQRIRFRARADNNTVNSAYSYSPYEYTLPAAPTDVASTYVSDSIINLTWSDNSAYEDGFRILVSIDGGAFTQLTPGVNTVGAGTTSYIYTDVNPNMSYAFRVEAHVPATIHNSDISNSTDSATVKTSPAAPTNLAATYASDTEIDLSWDDNSNVEDAYTVSYSTDGSSFTELGDISADSTSYQFTTGSTNERYYFRVEAKVNGGTPENSTDLVTPSNLSNDVYTTPLQPSVLLSEVSPYSIVWGLTDSANYDQGVQLLNHDDSFISGTELPNITSLQDSGLIPNTSYTRKVRYYTYNGPFKVYSPEVTVSATTLAATPDIEYITELTSTKESIVWEWDGLDNPGGTEYKVDNLTTNTSSGWMTAQAWTQTSLECSTEYTINITSRNSEGTESTPTEFIYSTDDCDLDVETVEEITESDLTSNITGVCLPGSEVEIAAPEIVNSPITASCINGTFSQEVTFAPVSGSSTLQSSVVISEFVNGLLNKQESVTINLPESFAPTPSEDSGEQQEVSLQTFTYSPILKTVVTDEQEEEDLETIEPVYTESKDQNIEYVEEEKLVEVSNVRECKDISGIAYVTGLIAALLLMFFTKTRVSRVLIMIAMLAGVITWLYCFGVVVPSLLLLSGFIVTVFENRRISQS